jgi:hypothetical protein
VLAVEQQRAREADRHLDGADEVLDVPRQPAGVEARPPECLQLGARVLESFGLPDEAVAQRLDEVRDEEFGRLSARPQ